MSDFAIYKVTGFKPGGWAKATQVEIAATSASDAESIIRGMLLQHGDDDRVPLTIRASA
ncbi:hypothetical protein [Rhizobium sp. NFR03]|uniref:hypothetical protein n=1 Tax=Rhizobium sp. NFR03 TaxID=1566263 RepID=UPI0008C5650A|nr:hypothetical protein [Rhizobium sp. NFR03]SES05698.1 hypothetical protein SAMN03159406_01966 [Rhizobium sp. NFR03]